MKRITIRRPDDWHVHLRDELMLKKVTPFTAEVFGRALTKGNLAEPVWTPRRSIWYGDEIELVSQNIDRAFKSIVPIMMIKQTTKDVIVEAYFKAGVRVVTLIPEGVSTNSDEGVPLERLDEHYETLETVRRLGMVFSLHCELARDPRTRRKIPYIRQEQAGIPYLEKLVRDMPGLKTTVEHITTREMIEFVKSAPPNVAATITAHHPLINYNEVCNKRGRIINPLLWCKPVAKNEDDQRALVEAMASGNPKFFFGSDSAPHIVANKHLPRPRAGLFTAPVALRLLCEIFEQEGKLDKLEDFTSRFGAEYYGVTLNTGTVTLIRKEWEVPKEYRGIPIFWGGKQLSWKVAKVS